jgi:hypothetical protein
VYWREEAEKPSSQVIGLHYLSPDFLLTSNEAGACTGQTQQLIAGVPNDLNLLKAI